MSNSEAEAEYNRVMAAAAEKAIADLKTEVEKGREAAAAVRKAARIRMAWNAVLSIVVAAMVLIYFQLHSQAVSSCQQGNDRASGTVVALDQLVNILEGPTPKPDIKQIATQYEAFVATHNAPRDCSQAYRIIP
jgi:hypothetical protein